MRIRGVIEGFYGPPWTHEQRLDLIGFCGAEGLNTWVHAPKDDPYHRARWRDPYPDDEVARLAELVAEARRHDIDFAYAIAPGLDLDYADPGELETLLAKLDQLHNAGVHSFQLLWDDIESRAGAEQAAFTNRVARELGSLVVCPVGYAGTGDSEYRRAFAPALDEDLVVYWTGPEVVSLAIAREELDAAVRRFADHELLLWDNYPVNDFSPDTLFLGPLRGRDARLAGAQCAGIVANGMLQAVPSKLAIATLADWARDPSAYDPLASFERALRAYGAEVAVALDAEPADVQPPPDLAALVDALTPGVDAATAVALLRPFV
ncbi:MAG TPA: protein O-GlcNAcase [Gaiellaceae bacterium]